VHRDIKPDNILLTEGHALVADFGIARALTGGGDDRLTATGTSIGTAAYMSPEQAAGEREVDARSDVYSLAIVLYEMLAGVTPFAAATPQATIARRFTETPALLRTHRDTVPVHVERAIARALSRTAADRFDTAREFRDALGEPAVSAPTVAASPVSASHLRLSPLQRVRRAPSLIILMTGLLLGSGALFAWSRSGRHAADPEPSAAAGSSEAAPVRIAVLPFENMGDTSDGYFADGLTEAVRAKLAGIKGFQVIARTSSEQYRGGMTPPAQVADELGVDYLLTGTVRWVKNADGTSRVQVRPELVEIGDGTAHTRWGDAFNAPLDDVFQVQEQIADHVSGALDVALGTPDQERLAQRPTEDIAAYNLYLQAEAISGTDPGSLRRAIALLERAVARDSTFGIAWARLAVERIALRERSTNPPPIELVREALDRARELAPATPETYRARIAFAGFVDRDNAAAIAIGEEGVRRFPNDAQLLRVLGGYRIDAGELEAGVPLLERAAALDPRDPFMVRTLGAVQLQAGRFPEAREQFMRALAIEPGSINVAASVILSWLLEGDLLGARRAMNEMEPSGGRPALLAYVSMYGDYYWLLDPAQQDTVMGLGPEWFDHDTASKELVIAQILQSRGDTAGARVHAAATAKIFERLMTINPDPQLPALVGFAYALQGRHQEARGWFARAVSAADSSDAVTRSYVFELSARASMLSDDRAAAVDAIEQRVHEEPVSRVQLRLNPEFAPLRSNPRFLKLTSM
jgi:serine/threonine-protein kinase